jgi:hypothetical protein
VASLDFGQLRLGRNEVADVTAFHKLHNVIEIRLVFQKLEKLSQKRVM